MNLTEKREKFRVLAERRTNAAIEAILRVGKLSHRQAYEFDEQDVKKIVRALRSSVTEIEERFSAPRRRSESKFTL
jgi:hypothetical protein